MHEEPLVGCLTECDEHHRVGRGYLEPLGELAHVRRHDRHPRRVGQRNADIGGAQDLAGKSRKGLTQLHGEGCCSQLLNHAEHRLQHLHELRGQSLRQHLPQLFR